MKKSPEKDNVRKMFIEKERERETVPHGHLKVLLDSPLHLHIRWRCRCTLSWEWCTPPPSPSAAERPHRQRMTLSRSLHVKTGHLNVLFSRFLSTELLFFYQPPIVTTKAQKKKKNNELWVGPLEYCMEGGGGCITASFSIFFISILYSLEDCWFLILFLFFSFLFPLFLLFGGPIRERKCD